MAISEKEAGIRLVKYLAAAGIASRRAAGDIVKANRVSINGDTVNEPGRPVFPGDKVVCDGKPVAGAEPLCYIMLNKPAGYTCSNADPHAEHLAIELIEPAQKLRLFSAGRLDKESEGLIIFSNDGDFVEYLTHPKHEVLKTYLVRTSRPLAPVEIEKMQSGIEDEGELLRARAVHPIRDNDYRFILNEGRKREIRRLNAAFGIKTLRLRRVRFGSLELGDLPSGKWRELTAAEVAALRQSGPVHRKA